MWTLTSTIYQELSQMCKFGIELSHSEPPMFMLDSELSQRDVT